MSPFTHIYSNLVTIIKVIDDGNNNGNNVFVPCDINANGSITPSAVDRAISVISLGNAPLLKDSHYLAFQIKPGIYVTHNQAVFLEFI